MRTKTRLLLGAAVFIAALWPVTAAGQESNAEDRVEVTSKMTVRASGARLLGRVSAPFLPPGEEESRECEGDRAIAVDMRTKRGYKPVGRDTTAADGTWAVRAKDRGAVYRIRARATEFAYSTEYGEVIQVRCRPTIVIGRRHAGGFKVLSDRVLGVRFGRRAGRLARTGLPLEVYTAIALSLIAAGVVLNRRAWDLR